jgi:ubiquinone/menaquinone biosynthesis C-methylase UbiE
MNLTEINKRYSELATTECCLSCGSAVIHAEPQPGETCVDLGSGRGTDVLRMAEKVGKNGFIYGIDISDGMLEKARQNAEKFNINNVAFIRCGLTSLDLPDNVADLVISNCTINHESNKQAVWNEIYRILKFGGRFVVSDIYSMNPVPEEFRNDPVAVAECWAGAVTRDEYLEHLNKAGLSSVNIIEESAPYEKGKIRVASMTITGRKSGAQCCCPY